MSPSQLKPTQIIDLLVELCDLKTIHSSMIIIHGSLSPPG